jgi:HlyD family secretion protein
LKNLTFRQTCTSLIGALLFTGCNIHKEKDSGSVSGTIETDEVHVASRYGGRVQSITAQEGDTLKPGQPFVQLEAGELLARRQFAESVLQELKAGPRQEELAAAKQEWEAAAAELEFARAENKRAAELFAKGTVTASERDRAVTRAASLEKSVAAAKSRSELLIAGTRPEKIAQAEAQLAEIETQLKEMQITAPTNCVLEVLKVKKGDVLPPNREVATLLLPQHLWARVYIAESSLGKIRIGEKVRVKVDSFPNQEFQGEVEQIARSAEFTPRNVQTTDERIKQVFGIKVRLPNSDEKLRAGMSADVFFDELISK